MKGGLFGWIFFAFMIVFTFFIGAIWGANIMIDRANELCSYHHIDYDNFNSSVPTQFYVSDFCKNNGYEDGWIDTLGTCGNKIMCYKMINDMTKYTCF